MNKPFEPVALPLHEIDYKRIIGLVARANTMLARYDGLLQGIVNPTLFLSPLTSKEAVLSSRIEGTQATLDEVLAYEAGDKKNGSLGTDIQEILNYRTSLMMVTEHVHDYPITLNLLLQLHKNLLNTVRGRNKSPGCFRTDQNWLGSPGCSIEEATYIPPSPLRLKDHLENWQKYIEFDDFDAITQTAIIHAQFELIHPFKDGNGRIGRLLIPLVLYRKKIISAPMFYISSYLEANRDNYYHQLNAISNNGDWNGWIEFFLNAVIHQADDNATRVRAIFELYAEMKKTIEEATHSQFVIRILDAIFATPIFTTTHFVIQTKIPKQSAFPLLKKLKDLNIVRPIREASGRTPAVLTFPALLDII